MQYARLISIRKTSAKGGIVRTWDTAVLEMPNSYMTVGRTNDMPHPPIPCVVQIMRNGKKVALLNKDLT